MRAGNYVTRLKHVSRFTVHALPLTRYKVLTAETVCYFLLIFSPSQISIGLLLLLCMLDPIKSAT